MRRWGVVLAIGFSVFMFTVDMNGVGLALPIMGKTFQQSDATMSWVIASYSLPLTLLMIPFGLVITRWPPLATQLIGVGGFGLASILCALAPSFSFLLIARALQGSFGALLGTQGVALVAAAAEPHERGRAMGLIGAMGPLGSVTGPGIGGLLLASWGWPSIFLINVPVVLVTMILMLLCLPGVSFGSLQLSGLSQMGYLLRHSRFLWSLLTLLFFSSASGALAYLLPFGLQEVHHQSLALAGTTLLVTSLGMAIISPVGGYLSDALGIRLTMPIGWIVTLLGLLALLLTIATPTDALNLDWRLLVIGLGNGIAYGPLITLIMSIGPRETLGAASALSGVVRQFGFICGPISVSLIWSWQVGSHASERANSSVLLLLALSIACLIFALFSVRGWSQRQASIIASSQEQITNRSSQAQ
ncbi:MFS transporter [Ktedonosporobacter rubrisoli]|uniref:MFS transporter n=1 Tax=Ktedonosporobacter rubrisoli TaxID=2509675 RepID=A0A4P6K5N0_KTERU|nr:MFS transporter [Ktedonosporobacter rubrisoli]QBD83283.1 MFS transporter [Ktedonosporobacter rubrisoli]